MRVLVCGGRDFNDYKQVEQVLKELDPTVIIQGGARGADSLGATYGRLNGLPVIEVAANWALYEKAAGHIRNQWMLDHCFPDLVVAFPGGKGTESMIRRAKIKGVEVKIIG